MATPPNRPLHPPNGGQAVAVESEAPLTGERQVAEREGASRLAATVLWRLIYRVAHRNALDRCLARTLPLIVKPRVVEEGKPYWKDHSLWECTLKSPLEGEAVSEQVLECLLGAFRLGSGWHLTGSLDAESPVRLEGVFDLRQAGSTSRVVGLEWAHFDVVADDSD